MQRNLYLCEERGNVTIGDDVVKIYNVRFMGRKKNERSEQIKQIKTSVQKFLRAFNKHSGEDEA